MASRDYWKLCGVFDSLFACFDPPWEFQIRENPERSQIEKINEYCFLKGTVSFTPAREASAGKLESII
jgi:hypothetical protein